MEDIILSSNWLEIVAINKRTSAELFKHAKVGDRIQILDKLTPVNRSRGLRATYYQVILFRDDLLLGNRMISRNILRPILGKFKFKVLNEG